MENNKFGKYLFHYTKMSISIEYILNAFELKFSKFTNLNDPIENKKFNISVWQNFSYKFDEFINKSYKAEEVFYNNSYLLCFSIDKNENNNEIRDGYNLFKMWAQYSENFKGVCFIFDRRKMINEIYNRYKNDFIIFNKKVEYKDLIKSLKNYTGEIINIKSNNFNDVYSIILNHLKKNNKRLYFTKDNDWEGENEYRIVLFQKDYLKKIIDIKVPIKNILEGIILGCNLNVNYNILFKELLKNKRIKLFKQGDKGISIKEII